MFFLISGINKLIYFGLFLLHTELILSKNQIVLNTTYLKKDPEAMNPFDVSPYTISSKSCSPKRVSEEGLQPPGILFILIIPACFPIPDYTNEVNYLKLIPQKLNAKQKLISY